MGSALPVPSLGRERERESCKTRLEKSDESTKMSFSCTIKEIMPIAQL